MSIDKSWIHIKNRLSDEYWKGLRGFIEYAKNFANSTGHISCPCKRCLNKKMLSLEEVDKHIFRNGFDVTYTKWVFHGEMPGTTLLNNPVVVSESDDEMAAVLNDVVGAADVLSKQNKNIMMVEERQIQMLESGSVNEKGILNKNMKKRRGRRSGVGLTLTKSAFRHSNGVESVAGTSTTPEVHAHIQRLETTVTRLMDALQRFIPGFQLDQSNDPSSSSSAAQNHADEDATDLQD